MNIKKEDVILFFRQNVKSIILAFVCSLVLIIGGLFYFNQNKIEDYSGVSFSNISNETNNKDEKAEDKHDEKIFVDVKGAVKHPGVFETTKDKRVKDLIEEAGRMDSPGRPKLYRTTTYFMDYFGLETLDQLPDVESLLELNQEESKQLFKNNEDLFAELEQKHQEEETIS